MTYSILVLGFYNRHNIGDEMYKMMIPQIFPQANFTFVCTDDIFEIPNHYDFVICGGGDIINAYFMQKIELLLSNYTGRVYGFSIGIPYESETRYLHLFDHVFVRSLNDYKLACTELGSINVTLIPDAAFALNTIHKQLTSKKIIGICLAQPAFHNNANAKSIINNICNALSKYYYSNNNISFILLSFNHSKNKEEESDFYINNIIFDKLNKLNIPITNKTDITTFHNMIETINNCNIILGMRYHSIVFSLILNKPIIALYSCQKVHNIVHDYNIETAYKLDTDNDYKPIYVSENKLYKLLSSVKQNDIHITYDWNIPYKIMFQQNKYINILIKNNKDSFENALFNCKKFLMKYLNITSSDYESTLSQINTLNIGNHDHADVARLLCYCITKSIQSPYLWGLIDNMKKQDFCLLNAIRYIWEDFNNNNTINEFYYPIISSPRQVFYNLDFVFQNDFKNCHRSGWYYVVGGLMNFDAHQLLRQTNIMIDTHVDRSFHWGEETLKTVGIIPYTSPWIGFIHHTFDKTHSSYNCNELFKKESFITSLKTCKGIISLTNYLTNDLSKILNDYNIPVFTIYHPMEMVDKLFTIDKFLKNKQKKIVQIGAWLRNPYSIYQLSLWKNTLNIQKVALMGKEMDLYFQPENLLQNIKNTLKLNLEPKYINKYSAGLFNTIQNNYNSVSILKHRSNIDYDILLSENIVFLDLIDCSAVNTILECLVRNTPLIVNRHPAIEEILGKEYPGFYNDLIDATLILNDIESIKHIHNYLKNIDKSQYSLDVFVQKIQNVIKFIQKI